VDQFGWESKKAAVLALLHVTYRVGGLYFAVQLTAFLLFG
jgi:hypothetical protein